MFDCLFCRSFCRAAALDDEAAAASELFVVLCRAVLEGRLTREVTTTVVGARVVCPSLVTADRVTSEVTTAVEGARVDCETMDVTVKEDEAGTVVVRSEAVLSEVVVSGWFVVVSVGVETAAADVAGEVTAAEVTGDVTAAVGDDCETTVAIRSAGVCYQCIGTTYVKSLVLMLPKELRWSRDRLRLCSTLRVSKMK